MLNSFRRRTVAAVVALALIGGTAPAQQPAYLNQARTYGVFTPVGRAPDLAASSVSSRVALGVAGAVAWVCNTGSADAYVKLGNGTVAASASADTLVRAGNCLALEASGLTNLAAITAASTTTIVTSVGFGNPSSAVNAGGNTTVSGNVTVVPSSSASAGIAPSATQTAASNSVFKGAAGNLYALGATIGATPGWLMAFDATTLPANGATGASLKFCYPINSDGTKGGTAFRWDPPLVFATGITIGFSSTSCNSLTASATAFFYGQVQ